MNIFNEAELEAGDVHLLRRHRSVESIQPSENAVVHLRGNSPCVPRLPKFRQGFALEGLDHRPICKRLAYNCQRGPPIKSGCKPISRSMAMQHHSPHACIKTKNLNALCRAVPSSATCNEFKRLSGK